MYSGSYQDLYTLKYSVYLSDGDTDVQSVLQIVLDVDSKVFIIYISILYTSVSFQLNDDLKEVTHNNI